MEIAKVKVYGTQAVTVSAGDIPVGIIGATVSLEFSPEWAGLTKNVVFLGAKDVAMLDVQDSVYLPPEVVSAANLNVKMGVCGVDANKKMVIPTLWADLGVVKPGTPVNLGYDPQLPVWAQLLGMIGDLRNLTTKVRDNLVNAINEAAQSGANEQILQEAINKALEQAKASGEFDGEDGQDGATFTPFIVDGWLNWRNDGGRPNPASTYVKGDPGKSAYQYAVDGGYTGTEAEFAELMANGSKAVQPDWNQNDPAQPDYVKNRTHWEEDTRVEINITSMDDTLGNATMDGEVALCKISSETPSLDDLSGAILSTNFGDLAFYLDESKALTAESGSSDLAIAAFDGAALYIVYADGLEGNGLVFPTRGIYAPPVHMEESIETVGYFKLTYGSTTVHQIDERFIPDNIARVTAVMEPGEEDIPKVFFGGALPQTKDDAVMRFRYISKTEDISGWCTTKAQGNSSMGYPKKNQTVKLYRDAECTEKLKVDFKGWGEQNKFCFKANWIDLTHARNIVSARLWGDVVKSRENYDTIPELLRTSPNQGAVDGFPVKVYANGIYQGRYTINIPKDAWMANMDDELDSHCILCGENYNSGCFRAEANINGGDWTDEVHDTVPASIKTRWNEAISFVMNSTDEAFVAGIGNYFDLESLIDYYLFGLASCGLDAFGKNQLYMTYDGGQKWYASMYDMDSTWGLWWTGHKFVPVDYPRNDYQDFKDGEGNLLYIRLETLFAEEIKARWDELKSGALSLENIMNRFERFTDIAPPYLVAEDYASTTANGEFTGIPSVSTNNIQQIRAYAVERLAWVETYLRGEPEVLYQLPQVTVLDGTNYIDTGVPLFDTAKDFTVFAAFDCQAPESGTWGNLVSCGAAENDDNRPLLLGYDNGNAYPKLRTGGNANHSWEDVVTGAWGHGWINLGAVALVFVGGVFSFGRYLRKDNNAISYIKPAEGIAYIPDNRNCIIGGKTSFWSGNVGNFFKGTVKDFRIYGRALTEEEVAALMTEE